MRKIARPLCLVCILAISCVLGTAQAKQPAKQDTGKQPAAPVHVTAHPLPMRSPLDNLDPRAYDSYVNGLLLLQINDVVDAAASFKKALEYFPESYEIGLALAAAYYNLRKPDDALQVLSQLVPRTVEVYQLSAACFRALGDNESVKGANLRIVELDSANVAALNFLAGAYRQQNRADSLLWVYEKLVKATPGSNWNIWNDIGRLRAQAGRTADAKDAFRTSIGLNSSATNAIAFAALGELYDLLKKPDSAALVLKQGLQIAGDNLMLHKAIVSHYIKQDSLAAAVPYAKRICDLAPLDKDAMRRLAILYFSADSIRPADSIFTYLASGNDKDPGNFFYMGQIAVHDKDYGRALKEFKTLALLADTSADSWLALANVYRLQNQKQDELETYKEGLNHMESESNAIRLLFAVGATQERMGLFDDAVSTFEKLLSKAPKHSQSLNYLGYMMADKGVRLDSAKSLISRALEIEPENAAFLDSYGWVLYRLKEYKASAKYLRKAVGLIADSVVYDHLGDVLKAQGHGDEARVWWEKALQLAPENAAIREKLGR